MNKRTRFFILLAVLAICLVFLWPSITWYFGTPKSTQALALSPTEKIKEYAINKASEDVNLVKNLAEKDPLAMLDPELNWIEKKAQKQYKNRKLAVPSTMNVVAILSAYESEREFLDDVQAKYRDEILDAKKAYTNSVKLGLDLKGGMNVIVKADLDQAVEAQKKSLESVSTEQDYLSSFDEATFRKEAMANAIENLSGRVDRFGLSSPVIRQQGADRIYIEIPGAAQADAINTLIMGKGVLNFRLSDAEATANFNAYYNNHPASTFNAQGQLIDPTLIPEDCEVLGWYNKDKYGLDELFTYVVVKKEIALDGKHIQSADIGSNQLGEISVNFNLDSEGTKLFADLTAANKEKTMAIVSDNKVKSNAVIQAVITNGQVQLSGSFSFDEANNIKKVLQTAWLDIPLEVESQQQIGASLGEQAIKQGALAILLGLALILVFMLLFYKASGFNAIVAQILNLYIMFSILSAFNLTLTLSSIAGMILTIGMAVDANVLVFERIKEEIRLGKTRPAAISMGFSNAFWAIMDSNITTFIAALFLSQLGTGSIQGFAVSLAIGVLSSVFTALFVSRLMFDFATDVFHSKKVSIAWGLK